MNFAAGVASSGWTAAVNLLVVPFYLKYLGLEAYGLVGFFAALQGLMALLDLGLTSTLVREVAQARERRDAEAARDLAHTAAVLYWGVAALVAVCLWLCAPVLARDWLQKSSLSQSSISQAVALIGVVLAVRWPLGVYTGVLIGSERLWLASAISMAMVALANFGALLVLALASSTVEAYFIWQAAAGLAYVVVMRAFAWRVLDGRNTPRFDLTWLKRVWRFSMGMSVTAILGVVFAQSDKVLLSKMVPLEDLAKYTLVGIIGRTLVLVTAPAFNVIYPRMTVLVTRKDTDAVRLVYKTGTRALTTVTFTLAAYVGVFAIPIVSLWTGDALMAKEIAPVVALTLFGTAANSAMIFPYALQLASGKSYLAATISLILVVIFIPMLYLFISYAGITGAAGAWAAFNALYLVLGAWLTHRVVLRGDGLNWLLGDVGLPLLSSLVFVVAGGELINRSQLPIGVQLVFGGMLAIASVGATLLCSPALQNFVRGWTAAWRPRQNVNGKSV